MPTVTKKTDSLTIVAYPGDAKTLLAFDLPEEKAANLAGFTIECTPQGQQAYYLENSLQFEQPEKHAQDTTQSPTSSINAPLHKFRWMHVPGTFHQGLKPFRGPYTYAVTPRYFDEQESLQPLDPSLSASLDIDVVPFETPLLALAFTRGYTQSQGFVNHFGADAPIHPKTKELLFDTSQVATTNDGTQFTYADEYEWLGFTARETIFALLNEVLVNPELRLDMFAYDLNEPDLLEILLELAGQGRVRIILDNAPLHHSTSKPPPEDKFETVFRQKAQAPADMLRGHFGRYAHDKVLIVSDAGGAKKVLTGSTNFSVTGLYVNSNHVLVFTGSGVPEKYAELFEEVWKDQAELATYLQSPLAGETFSADGASATLKITFAPHSKEFASDLLGTIVARIGQEGTQGGAIGNVLFAVMELAAGSNVVYDALNKLHANEQIFSFGISDSPAGISLYAPGQKTGVLVTGKPVNTQLPPPFNQVPGVGLGHQIHHKFVVCGLNGPDPVVFCGSSNLALGGEQANGDNLLEIHDADVVTAFAIEALALVDHFQFLDRAAHGPAAKKQAPPASKQQAAASAGWFLSTSDAWAKPYFDPSDLHSLDRRLFAEPAQ
jgi:hypothetical protein